MFDFRNESLLDWLREEYLGGPLGLASPNVDFFFLDDSWKDPSGPTEVGPDAIAKMGLSKADVTTLTQAYTTALRAMNEYVVEKGGFTWASFSPGGGTLAGPPFSPSECTTYMRETACVPNSTLQTSTLFYGLERGSCECHACTACPSSHSG
jgi:hypothetical protein